MEQVKSLEEFRASVITEMNLVRTDPQSYASKIRKYATYFKGKVLKVPEIIPIMTTEGAKAFEEAAKCLDNLDQMEPLKYSPGLTHAAHDVMKEIQKIDDLDHIGDLQIDEYLSKYGEVFGIFAQACDFGSPIAELVVVNLLVDDGDLNRGNRSNIINQKFKLIGVSTGSHPVYHNCTVAMYARHFYNLNEKPIELSDDEEEQQAVPETKKETSDTNQKLNVVRRESLGKNAKFAYVKEEDTSEKPQKAEPSNEGDDFDLPPGCAKIERQEKKITENGVKKKIVKLTKHMEDGSIETEVFKVLA